MTFDDGGCRDAGGQVSVEAGFGAGAPVRLAGGLACQGKAGVAALRSAGGTPAVAATVSFERDGRFELASTVASADPGVRAALLLGGFQPGAAGLTRTDQGRLLR